MRKLQTDEAHDHLRHVGFKVGSAEVWINGNGETGPIDELTAHALLTHGGWIDVTPEAELPHEDAHPDDDESIRPRRRGRKAKAEGEAGTDEALP